MEDIQYSKICPTCSEIVYYKTKESFYSNYSRKTPCRKCKGKLHSILLTGRKRPLFSKEWKHNIAISHKNSEVWKQSMNTLEYKEKHRQKMLRMIKEGKHHVAFNSKACNVFNFINKKLKWYGHHAQNEKEHLIDVFYLDYYVPDLNIAIEWDEKHHQKPSRYKGDWIKQKVIIDSINCEFYRVDDVTKKVKKVDELSIDRTQEIQRVIDEYYEIKK